MKQKINITNITEDISDVSECLVRIIDDRTYSTDEFHVGCIEYIQLFIIGHLLMIEMHDENNDCQITPEQVRSTITKYVNHLFDEMKQDSTNKLTDHEIDGLFQLTKKLCSLSELTKSDYFKGKYIQEDTSSPKHVRAFGVESISDMPKNNYVLKVKPNNHVEIHVRIGIDNDRNQMRIMNIIQTKENNKKH